MRLKFFVAHQLPTTPVPEVVKAAPEEVIAKESEAASSSMYSESNDDSTSLSGDSADMIVEDDGTPLPEFNSDQANILKRLLLSPLEPDMEF